MLKDFEINNESFPGSLANCWHLGYRLSFLVHYVDAEWPWNYAKQRLEKRTIVLFDLVLYTENATVYLMESQLDERHPLARGLLQASSRSDTLEAWHKQIPLADEMSSRVKYHN